MWLGWASWEGGGALSEDLAGVSQLPHKVSVVGFALCNMACHNMPSLGVRDERGREKGRGGERQMESQQTCSGAEVFMISEQPPLPCPCCWPHHPPGTTWGQNLVHSTTCPSGKLWNCLGGRCGAPLPDPLGNSRLLPWPQEPVQWVACLTPG